ncbi:MAG: HdeA family protein [Magnetococcus sp. THC-1_WYH]
MKKIFKMFMIALAFTMIVPEHATARMKKSQEQSIDFSSFTCSSFIKEMTESSEEDAGAVLLWLDGYLSGVSGDTVLHWKGFEQFAENLVTHCQDNKDQMLLDAAKNVGIE